MTGIIASPSWHESLTMKMSTFPTRCSVLQSLHRTNIAEHKPFGRSSSYINPLFYLILSGMITPWLMLTQWHACFATLFPFHYPAAYNTDMMARWANSDMGTRATPQEWWRGGLQRPDSGRLQSYHMTLEKPISIFISHEREINFHFT